VLYRRVPRLLDELALARVEGTHARLLGKLAKFDVLVLDDLGLGAPKDSHRHDLLEVIEDRYGRVSTVVTSQLPVGKWHEWIGDPTMADAIFVVAPYNAHVSALRRALPPEVRVGTVDKFQGREAPIVVYSTAEDAPRGLEFLYRRNRLNVAISRAQALSVLVASPALVQVACKTPRQMRLVNALCRFVEMAGEQA
jgi:uncharacterized protein